MLILSFDSLIVDLSPQFLHCSICMCVLFFLPFDILIPVYADYDSRHHNIKSHKYKNGQKKMIWVRKDLADKTQWLISLFCTFTDIIRGPDTLNCHHVGSVSSLRHLFSSHCDSHICTITNCTYFLFSILQMDLLPSCAVRWVDYSVQLKKSVINNPDFICYFTKLRSKFCKTLYAWICEIQAVSILMPLSHTWYW